MAEEERILITKIQPECKFRELHETTAGGHTWVDFMCGKATVKKLECDEKCFEQCEWKELIGISRQEAIERMAKAICSVWGISSCKSCAFKGDGSMCQDFIDAKKGIAEAALNALLGE